MIYLNGRKINYYIFNYITTINFLFLIISAQSINSIIEIPIEIINIKNNFKNQLISKNYPKFFIEEGVTKINSQHLFLANIKLAQIPKFSD